MKYFHLFQTKSAHDAEYYGSDYNEPWVGYTVATEDVTYNKPYEMQYLTFKALESGTFKFSGNSVNYSVDKGRTWTTLASNTNTPALNAGDTIMFKAQLTPGSTTGVGRFSSTGMYEAKGNPYSLLYGDDFIGVTDLTGKNSALRLLFYNSSGLTSAEHLSLPATTLSESAYTSMFYNCSGLTAPPEVLPAKTLTSGCYSNMFALCYSLRTSPSFSPTTVAGNCCNSMFYSCSALTETPELPATTLAPGCYQSMFSKCTSLTSAPSLPATTFASSCYNRMFYRTGLLPDTSKIDFTSETIANSGALQGLFAGTPITDSILNGILPKNSQNKYCLPVETLNNRAYADMFRECSGLTVAPELPATTIGEYCYETMFAGCSALTTAPSILPALELKTMCYSNMFSACTSITTAPELPATTLASSSYHQMFSGCTSLNYVKAMFTTTPGASYTSNWVSGVAASGTFVKNSAATWTTTGANGVPTGWTVQTASS